jgi:4-amino-4-deoxy-L-arabinose transferase-like glycosyltransferase
VRELQGTAGDTGRRRFAFSPWWAVVAGAALLLRVLYWMHPRWFNPAGYVENPDEQWYNALAIDIARGHGFDPQATFYTQSLARWPGYPYALGALYRVLGVSLDVAHAYNVLLGVLACLAIGALAREIAGSRAALLAGLAAAVFPPLLYHVLPTMTEAQFTLLYVTSVWLVVRYLRAPSAGRMAAAGLVIGLAALTRASGILVLPCAALAALALVRSRAIAFRHAALAVLVTLVTIAPWGVRNWIVWHRVVPLGTGGAYLLYSGNSAFGEQRFLLNDRIPEAPFFRLMASKPDAWFFEQVRAYVRANPMRFARLTWAKLVYLWKLVPKWRSPAWSLPAYAVYLGPPLCAAVGLLLFARSRAALLTMLLIATYSALFALTIPELRYRVTVIDTLLLAWAGSALARVRHG